MDNSSPDIELRVRTLERQVGGFQIAAALATVLVVVSAIWSAVVQAQDSKLMRVRSLIIEDASGRDRILLGAPLADPQGRVSTSSGLKINDQNGVERFAVGLLDNGRVVMGFDAPPGTGDPRNRERLTLAADAAGGAYIRFLTPAR